MILFRYLNKKIKKYKIIYRYREMVKIYVLNRLTIKSKNNNWLYKYTYNPHLVNFHQENSDYNGNLTFEKQFDDIAIKFYKMYIKNLLSITNELDNVNKYTFFGCDSDAKYIDFTYYDDTLIYQFVTENSYPETWYKFIKCKYPQLDFSLEYIIQDENEISIQKEKFCFCFTQSESNYIYKNVNNKHKSYIKID